MGLLLLIIAAGITLVILTGLLEAMTYDDRLDFEIIAMCFPTPRDGLTDRVMALFDRHVNLSPQNKCVFSYHRLAATCAVTVMTLLFSGFLFFSIPELKL